MNKGFTLIELLVVVLIIGILAATALPQYTKAVEKSRATEAMTLLGNLATAEQVYKLSTGSFTNDLTALDLLLPGVTGTFDRDITTKNFKVIILEPSGASATTGTHFRVQAQRIDSTGASASGDLGYHLMLEIDSDGDISRTCAGSYMCKSITNGVTCDGTNTDWCFDAPE